jgi:hypothetical protein
VPIFFATLLVRDANGQVVLRNNASQEGRTRKEAQEAAAADAWLLRQGARPDDDDATATKGSSRASAWVGDSALNLLVGLLGLQAGLRSEEMYDITAALFSNSALAAVARSCRPWLRPRHRARLPSATPSARAPRASSCCSCCSLRCAAPRPSWRAPSWTQCKRRTRRRRAACRPPHLLPGQRSCVTSVVSHLHSQPM